MGYKIVILVIAIVFVLFSSGITMDSFADHNTHSEQGTSAYFYYCTGNGHASHAHFTDLAGYVQQNNGASHFCAWNWIHGGDPGGVHQTDSWDGTSTLPPHSNFDARVAGTFNVVVDTIHDDYEQRIIQVKNLFYQTKWRFGEVWVCTIKNSDGNCPGKGEPGFFTKIKTPEGPQDIAAIENRIFVTMADDDSIRVFDHNVVNNDAEFDDHVAMVHKIIDCDSPGGIAVVGNIAYISCFWDAKVARVTDNHPVYSELSSIPVGNNPTTVFAYPGLERIYVYNNEGTIAWQVFPLCVWRTWSVIDTNTASVVQTIDRNRIVKHNFPCGSNPPEGVFPDTNDDISGVLELHWEPIVQQFVALFSGNPQPSTALHSPVPYPQLDLDNTKLLLSGYSFGGGAARYINVDPDNSPVTFDILHLEDPVGNQASRRPIMIDAVWNTPFLQAWFQFQGLPPLDFTHGSCNNNECNTNPTETIVDQRDIHCRDRDLGGRGVHNPGLCHGIVAGDQPVGEDPFSVAAWKKNVEKMNLEPELAVSNVIMNEGEFAIIEAKATDCASYWETNDYLKNNNFNNRLFWLIFTSQQRQSTFDGFNDPSGNKLEMDLFFHLVNSTNNGLEDGNEIPNSISKTLQVTPTDLIDKCKVKLPGLDFNAEITDCTLPNHADGRKNIDCNQPNAFYAGVTNYQQTLFYEKTAEVTGPYMDDGNATSSFIKQMQVEDNGFPCKNCTHATINNNGSAVSDCQGAINHPGGIEQCKKDRLSDDYLDPQPGEGYTIAKGSKGSYAFQDFTITVLNVPPTVHNLSEPLFNKLDATILVRTTDPSMADTKAGFNYTIDWGDGSEYKSSERENAISSFSHAYAQSGIYQVKVNATDKDGDTSNQTPIDVATPFVRLYDLIDDWVTLGSLNEGQGNSFNSKLNLIIKKIDKDHLTPACNVANALINQGNAFVKSGKLSEQQGQFLIGSIEFNKDQIGCNGNVVIVEKQTIGDPNPLMGFEFTGDVNGIISSGQKITLRDVDTGEFTSTETEKDFLEHIICTDSNSSGVVSSGTATFRVEDGDNAIKCVFVNEIPVAENSQGQAETFFGRGSVSTSSDTAISDIRLHTVTGSSNPSSPQTSDDLTDDDKGGGGDEHLTRPTFGVSHETFETIVDSGFRFNDQSFTINDNFHTPFAQQTVNIGEVNTFEAKIYADKRLKVQEFLFGIPNVGEAHLAELGVEVWYDYNGEIEEVKAVQKSNVIDKETIVATHEKTKCQSSDIEERCDFTNVSMVFLEPLQDKVMAVKAIDYKGRYQITYLNEGVDIAGESLNPMQTYLIPSNVRDGGLIKVTQLAKYSPYWQSDDGRMFEMNSFGSFKEINITFERFQDTGTAYTRLHSGFGGVMAYELKRATEIFDASELLKELPDYIPYTPPEISERMTEEMKAKMLEQEEIAKKIIEESKVQARW